MMKSKHLSPHDIIGDKMVVAGGAGPYPLIIKDNKIWYVSVEIKAAVHTPEIQVGTIALLLNLMYNGGTILPQHNVELRRTRCQS